MLYLACFAILYVGARGFFAERVARLDALAGKLYPALRGNDFDAWEMAVNGSVALYAYDTDAQERRTIAQISLPPDLLEANKNQSRSNLPRWDVLCGAVWLGRRADGRVHCPRGAASDSGAICHAIGGGKPLLALRSAGFCLDTGGELTAQMGNIL